MLNTNYRYGENGDSHDDHETLGTVPLFALRLACSRMTRADKVSSDLSRGVRWSAG